MPHAQSETVVAEYVRIIVDKEFNLSFQIDGVFLALIVVLAMGVLILKIARGRTTLRLLRRFEIDEAQFGLGNQKVTLHPNLTDMQIAYKIWVELSTRKIGLRIDLDDDVISEIYDSWYNFFSVTRELIKDVPVSRFRRKDTEQVVRLCIEVLNTGIRPHLTKWQARFRRWYEQELRKDENVTLHPQDIQRRFPEYENLQRDLTLVNERLINYRQKMYELVTTL